MLVPTYLVDIVIDIIGIKLEEKHLYLAIAKNDNLVSEHVHMTTIYK